MFSPKSTIAFPNQASVTANLLQSLKTASGQPRPGTNSPNAVLAGGSSTFPQHVSGVTASLKKSSDVSSKATITFQRPPHDYLFVDAAVYVSGYQANPQPVKVATGQSPISFALNNTGESLVFTVQANGPTGSAPLNSAPTTTAKLVSTPLATTPTSGGTGVGVTAFPAQAHKWLNSVTAAGVFTATQPSFADLTGQATAGQLPNPTSSTIGGVQSLAAVTSKWINSISTSGVPTATQPAFSDIAAPYTISSAIPATGASNQNSQFLTMESQFWNGSASVGDDWTVQARIGSGTSPSASAFQIVYTGACTNQFFPILGSNLTFELLQSTAATALANQKAPTTEIIGTYWDGAASQSDFWILQAFPGTGSNPTETFRIFHTGSTGVATLDLTNTAGTGGTMSVTLPTLAADTNTTGAASTAFVIGQASAVNPQPNGSVAVGTSKRYARADHVHATDATLAPLASPALTGTPTSPTNGTALDATTQIATDAFVQNAIAASFPRVVNVRTEIAAAAVDGANTLQYAIPTTGTYRISVGLTVRTVSSSAWSTQWQYSISPRPTGVGLATFNMVNGFMSNGVGLQTTTLYLHAADTISTGTFTTTGSNTGGVFDAVCVIERLS